MGFINLFVGSETAFRLKNKQLYLRNISSGDDITYPIEDINSVMIENNLSVISVQCINKLVENNVIVYLCDDKHLPSTYVLGYNSFYKNLDVYRKQVSISKPFGKQLWRTIVKSKIINQSKVLDFVDVSNNLSIYADQVKSGDADNIESVVANKYFKLLFGKAFARRSDNLINSALNYGYAILRGAIARSVVAHGLQPFIGLHHINQLNNFNLVDDLIEPFRPVVDLYVANNFDDNTEDILTRDMKISLLSLLTSDVDINGAVYDISTAIDMYVSSFVQSISTEKDVLKLPILLEFEVHKYE